METNKNAAKEKFVDEKRRLVEYQDKMAKEKQREQQRLLQLEQERLKQHAEQQRLLQQQQVSGINKY